MKLTSLRSIARFTLILFGLYFTPLSTLGQDFFIPNEGQWNGDFLFQGKFGNSFVYIGENHIGVSQVLYEDHHDHGHPHREAVGGHFYKMNFVDANHPSIQSSGEASYYLNFFLGKSSRWRSKVFPVSEIKHINLYEDVDAVFYTRYGQFKYDLVSSEASSLNQVKIYYEGVEGIQIIEGRLHVSTSVGEVIEIKPYAYHPDSKKAIEASYVLKGDTLSFQIDEDYEGPIVLDPTFIFSTYTGSQADNWGYSATYDPSDSSAYVAGIQYGSGGAYPTSTGAFDTTYNGGGCDIAISKFSPDGRSLIYSTYLGGSGVEQPSSIIADSTGRLIVIGPTGSNNFPVTPTAFDTTFNPGAALSVNTFNHPNGVDLFVTVFNDSGTALYGSTYVGGSGVDGMNVQLAENYGDWVRGEVILSPDNTILIASSTNSADIPLVNNYRPASISQQEAWILELPLECDTLLWSTTYGGVDRDGGFGVRVSRPNNRIYMCGSTQSLDLDSTANGAFPGFMGARDGFIVSFDENTRVPNAATYNGTMDWDMNFMMDLDRHGDVYVYGQTRGTYPTSARAINEINHSVFVHEISFDLSTDMRALAFGNKRPNSLAISPTAFAVDECGDVYLSGWGGSVNTIASTTQDMFTTSDAYQDSTRGSDLYFAVIDASFRRFNYATFFGAIETDPNQDREHVDGGTSRFDSKGIMYQATCAGCGGSDRFPTFPNDVYSRVNNSGNCNLAVTVIAFEQQQASVSLSAPDTVCSPFDFYVVDTITGADYVIWDFGNGDIDTTFNAPNRTFTTPGTYSVSVTAIDTNCGTMDSATLTFEVVNPSADANIALSYDECDPARNVDFITSSQQTLYFWDFGDGTTDTTTGNASHSYPGLGPYTVTVIATASNCFGSANDTSISTISFAVPPEDPEIEFYYGGCTNEAEARFYTETPGWHSFEWQLSDGQQFLGDYYITTIDEGFITATLTVVDTICNRTVTVSETFEAKADITSFAGQVPNVFTPDGDGINDFFQLQDGYSPSSLTGFSVKVYDRWGQPLYESGSIDFKWDGTVNGKPLTEGVYFWIISSASSCGGGVKENGVVHIMKAEE
ncbi:MAG: gliding motility-associated C-terminal domain-containing protein [Flavobacteriia bacterium]|nr:gliding motility-associated C-terminal domain-containing protein [Flavobacteriia bacterium]